MERWVTVGNPARRLHNQRAPFSAQARRRQRYTTASPSVYVEQGARSHSFSVEDWRKQYPLSQTNCHFQFLSAKYLSQ